MKYKLTIALICLLASCQSYRAERKINWLKKNNFLNDSVYTVVDTVKGFRIDTFIKFDTLSNIDTLITYREGIKVTTIIKWKDRTVYQNLIKNDTIRIRTQKDRIIYRSKNNGLHLTFVYVFIFLFLLILALFIAKN